MATWVIGDIHGCWETLQRLLDRIRWDPAADDLWLVGDLVNRGPASLEVLRWAVAHDNRITAVLGNHDLHLLARAEGQRPRRAEDRLDQVMAADDRENLLRWLRMRPFVHRRDRTVMVHAGLWPGWSVVEAEAIAEATATKLADVVPRIGRKQELGWRTDLEGDERLDAAAVVFTLMRTVAVDGRPQLGFTGPPDAAPEGCTPWFESSEVVRDGYTVIFGHWAMLGLYRENNVICLDSGCVYGGRLTALCLGTGDVVQQALADRVDSVEA